MVPAVRSLGPAAVPLVSVALPFLAPYSNHAGGASSTFLVTAYDDGGMCATRTLLALPSEPQALASCVFHFWTLLSFLSFCVCVCVIWQTLPVLAAYGCFEYGVDPSTMQHYRGRRGVPGWGTLTMAGIEED